MNLTIDSLYKQKGVFVNVCSYLNNKDINSFLTTCKEFHNFRKRSNVLQQIICRNLGVFVHFSDSKSWIETSQKLKPIKSFVMNWGQKLVLVADTRGIPELSYIPKIGHRILGDNTLQSYPHYFRCCESTTRAFFAPSLQEKRAQNTDLQWKILYYELDENKNPSSQLGTLVMDYDKFDRLLGICTTPSLDLAIVMGEKLRTAQQVERSLSLWDLINCKLLSYNSIDIKSGCSEKIDGIVWHEMKLYVWWQQKVSDDQYQQCCSSISFL